MPVDQLHMAITTTVGVHDGFKRWCGRGKNDRKFSDCAIEHGHVAGVISHTIILLVSTFMFFIDHDESQFFPRQKKRGACAHNNFCFAGRNAAPDAFAFPRPHVRMPLGRFTRKAGFDAGNESGGEGDFRQKQ